jgi:hypothetical protein
MARTAKNAGSTESTVKDPSTTRPAKTAPSALSHGGHRGGTASAETPQRGNARGSSEVWQARIGADLAAQLRADAEVLGLAGRTEIVKAALELIHRQAAEERMAKSVDDFYGGATPPLPLGVSDGGNRDNGES